MKWAKRSVHCVINQIRGPNYSRPFPGWARQGEKETTLFRCGTGRRWWDDDSDPNDERQNKGMLVGSAYGVGKERKRHDGMQTNETVPKAENCTETDRSHCLQAKKPSIGDDDSYRYGSRFGAGVLPHVRHACHFTVFLVQFLSNLPTTSNEHSLVSF